MNINDILEKAIAMGASDIHLARGAPPILRVNKRLTYMDMPPLEFEETKNLIFAMMNNEQRTQLSQDKEMDFSYSTLNGRFRVNAFFYYFGIVAAIRVIPKVPPNMQEIYMPEVAYKLARLPRGLVLVTGPTNRGKSTSLAAMIALINKERSAHIITLEDPIEFVFKNDKSLVHQRAVHVNTNSFSNGLRAVLRQDPDVLLVGEMRDLETIQSVLTIAETGPLVFATLHTLDAAQTIERIVEVFPSYQQQQIRYQLSITLKGVISQQLMPRQDKPGLIAAREIMLVTKGISKLIRDGEIHRVYEALEAGRDLGMIPMDEVLVHYVRKGFITKEDAVAKSTNPEEIQSRLAAL